jgi:hypothetical protein
MRELDDLEYELKKINSTLKDINQSLDSIKDILYLQEKNIENGVLFGMMKFLLFFVFIVSVIYLIDKLMK